MECLLPYLRMVTVPHIMVRLERMLDYRGVGLERFHCTIHHVRTYMCTHSVALLEHYVQYTLFVPPCGRLHV